MKGAAKFVGMLLLLLALACAAGAVAIYTLVASGFWIAISLGVVACFVAAAGVTVYRWSTHNWLTLDVFNRIAIGEGFHNCVTMLGSNGRHGKTDVEQVDGKVVERLQMFWDNSDGSFIDLVFEDGRVVSKSQFGLR